MCSTGGCPYGFLSVHVLSLWFRGLYHYSLVNIHRVRSSAYIEHNDRFMRASAASAAPRMYVSRDPTVVYYGLMGIVLGASDALAAVLPYSPADSYLLSILAIYLSKGRKRVFGILALVYCAATHRLPFAHELVRVTCLSLSVACVHLHFPRCYMCLRVLVTAVTALAYCTIPCVSLLRSVPPVLLVRLMLFSFDACPVAMLIITSTLV